MMFGLEYEFLYDLMIAMFGFLPCFKMYDRVSHMHLGFGSLLSKGICMCLGMNYTMLYA